jgi:precorrin-6B methylase 2
MNDALREVVGRLQTAAGALAALGAMLDADRRSPDGPGATLGPHLDAVLRALGLDRHVVSSCSREERVAIAAEIRTLMTSNLKLLEGEAVGWSPKEEPLMQAAGDATSRLPKAFHSVIAPKLDGLSSRLDAAGAAFLDVGVGVAALSIEMARVWPNLRVVGIDAWAPAVAIARRNVQAAGLEDRIELREGRGEELLTDERAFDLAWVPSLFVPETVLPDLFRRVRRSLKEGGWLLVPMLRSQSTDPLAMSVARLRTAFWGGSLLSIEEGGEKLLRECGFTDVRALPASASASTGMVAARHLDEAA